VVVTTAIAPYDLTTVDLNLFMFAMLNQDLRGSIFGSDNPRVQVPKLLRLHHEGKLHVDDLITEEYTVESVQQGYDDLASGKNVRGVVRF
jgi:Zn-dependent alcohol dehydrogenase